MLERSRAMQVPPVSLHWTHSVNGHRSWEKTDPPEPWGPPYGTGHCPVRQGGTVRSDGHPNPGGMWGTRAPPEWLPAGDRVAAFWSQAWRLGDNHHSLPRESSYSDIRSE